jgi:hypothetical protein
MSLADYCARHVKEGLPKPCPQAPIHVLVVSDKILSSSVRQDRVSWREVVGRGVYTAVFYAASHGVS